MNTVNIRNPQFLADGRIDCEIEHPAFGWVPFTASATDDAEHGRAIHAAAILMVPAPYVAAPLAPPDVPHGQRARWDGAAFVLEPLPPGQVLPEWVPPTPEQLQADALRHIDADADAIYAAVVGHRAAEYEQAERESQAWADAGHTDDAPASVHAWAQAAGLTGPEAAADILAKAAAWRSAMVQIRTKRLAAKARVRAGEVDAALADWADFAAAMRLQLGV